MEFHTDLSIGEKVVIDGGDMTMIVTAFSFRGPAGLCSVEVSWVLDGTPTSAWIEPWRLSRTE